MESECQHINVADQVNAELLVRQLAVVEIVVHQFLEVVVQPNLLLKVAILKILVQIKIVANLRKVTAIQEIIRILVIKEMRILVIKEIRIKITMETKNMKEIKIMGIEQLDKMDTKIMTIMDIEVKVEE